jgi:hypothetical protein
MPAYADNLSDSNTVFDWAENMYPQFFGRSGTETTPLEGYLIRYYPDTDTYVGTMGEDVYVYGTEFNGLLRVGFISDFIQTENLRFTHELLDGKSLYNVYYDDDDNDWDFCEFSFSSTNLTMLENGQTDSEAYSLTAEGYLLFEDPDNEEGEETEYNVVKITENTADYLTIAWEDSVDEANNADHGEEFFFFDQQKALDFQSRKNAEIAATTPSEDLRFTHELLDGKSLYNVYYESDENSWVCDDFNFSSTTLTSTQEDGQTGSSAYSLTAEGYLFFAGNDPDDDDNFVKITEKTLDYLTVAWEDSIEEANNAEYGEEFFFFDEQKAKDYTQARNTDLMQSNALFDWAENVYPEFFETTGAQTDISAENLTRHYQAPNNFIRVSNGEVSVEGESFGGNLDLGNISGFIGSTASEFSNELIVNKTLYFYLNAKFHININDDGSYDGENAMEQDFFGTWELVDGNLVLTPDANCTICDGVSTMELIQGYTFTDGQTLLFVDRNDGAAYPLYWLE